MNTTSSTIITALETAWKKIQTINPDTRDCIITIHITPADKRGYMTRGYFWCDSFISSNDESKADEIYINTAILNEGSRSILRTLLHEAAHSINFKRGIKDVTRQNRYHNGAFKKTAEEVGLITDNDKSLGIVTPDITEETVKKYSSILKLLESALSVYQNSTTTIKPKQPSRSLKAVCKCGRIIRITKSVYKQGSIKCGVCKSNFILEEDEEETDN